MSVRIYQLSKDIGLENSELLELLRERGFTVKSASSTIDNISADSLREEFAKKQAASEGSTPAASDEPAEEAPAAPPSAPNVASFVKSVDQIAEEKEKAREDAAAAAAAEAAAKAAPATPPAPPVPAPVAAPKAPAHAAPPPMAPPAGPGRMGPPASTPAPATPPVAAPQPVAPPAANPGIRPPASAAPGTPPVKAAPPPPVKAAPPPVRMPAAPPAASAPPPAAPAPMAPANPGKLPPPPGAASPANMAPPSAAPTGDAASADAADEEIKQITLKPPIVVRDFANELGVKPFKLISELMEMGIFASTNQSLDEEVASTLAAKHGFLLEIRHRGEGKSKKKKEEVLEDDTALLEHRPPVVCIMGHVDHGKTSLLDYIRKANVTRGEAGGITQHIGAYQIEHNDHRITFLDTPGHEAFNSMRERGADVTDIAILVVAADDGFKPQTDEALKFIQKSGVQPIVAINKIDTKGANIDRVKQQMQERGIASEDWGGQTICVECSAINGTGVSDLLDMVLLQAEVLELQANPKKPAVGIVIEASVEVGRGPTATVIVQGGTLKVGDALVCGHCSTKVKAMLNEDGKPVKKAPPSTPVRVIGWSDTPDCGAQFKTVKNEKVAKTEAAAALHELKSEQANEQDEAESEMSPQERLFAAIAKTQKKTLRVILKGDTFGSVEAIHQALTSITSDKVALEVIGKGVGIINRSDVAKASAGDAEIIGFNVKSDNGVAAAAKSHSVKISTFQIIYELIDRIREDMVEMLDPEFRENKIGAAEIRAVFPIAKGFVAGCLVTEGRVQHGALARVLRKNDVVHESKVLTLRRLKDDVKEVRAGTECGIQVARFNDYKVGDVIELFEMHEIRPEL